MKRTARDGRATKRVCVTDSMTATHNSGVTEEAKKEKKHSRRPVTPNHPFIIFVVLCTIIPSQLVVPLPPSSKPLPRLQPRAPHRVRHRRRVQPHDVLKGVGAHLPAQGPVAQADRLGQVLVLSELRLCRVDWEGLID